MTRLRLSGKAQEFKYTYQASSVRVPGCKISEQKLPRAKEDNLNSRIFHPASKRRGGHSSGQGAEMSARGALPGEIPALAY